MMASYNVCAGTDKGESQAVARRGAQAGRGSTPEGQGEARGDWPISLTACSARGGAGLLNHFCRGQTAQVDRI